MDLPAGKGRRCDDPNKRLQAQQLNLQLLLGEEFIANAVSATGGHWGITDAQGIAWGEGYKIFYNGGSTGINEKANYEKDMTDGKLDGKAEDGSSVGETGHYVNYVDDRYAYASVGVYGIDGFVQNYFLGSKGTVTNAYMPGWGFPNDILPYEERGITNQAMTLPENLLSKFDQYTALLDSTTTYTVSFDSAGGTAVASQSVRKNNKATQPANPTRNGYSFTGWYNGNTKYDFSTPVTSDLKLTARWAKNTVYRTVSFDSAGGTSVPSQRVVDGARAAQPSAPTRSGYSFAGWYAGNTKWDFSNAVTSDLKLTARWTKNQTPQPTVKQVPVYRVYNRNSGLHHYTTNKAENDMLVRLGWRDENHGKSSFVTVSKDTPGARPVYREYNRRSGNHNWTLNKAEHDMLVRLGWKNEGVAWYTSPKGQNVYRLYNPKPYHKPKNGRGNGGGEHVYTTSYGEYLAVIKAGWRGEGIAWQSL
ncbi:InlB B-repeat-containing protein [Bifidobacterium simiarum]|nr:InlB B-repeat-containing protein [Bifidobacterium simiarum]